MSVPLRNPRHEKLAQGLAQGLPAVRAHQEAGYKADRGHASRLAANGSIRARVAEILGRAAARAEVTIETIAAQLDEDRVLAHAGGQAGAAVAATMGKAKIFGLITDKHMVGMKRIEEMTEAELLALLGESDAGSRNPG